MGEFLHKYNTDNVHTRAVIVGLVNLLNSKVQYQNVLSDSNVETITVPFIPNMGGDERFLQDFFLHWNDCVHPRMADGNYDVIPRGVVTLSSNSINTTAMTHRFVRGSYVKEVGGELQRFNAFLNSIPLTMDFDVEIHTDTLLDSFKIQQSILETFYKVQVFSVNFKGFRVPCQAGFSDSLGIEKTFEFTYQTNEKIVFKVPISIETYFPVIDPTTERRDSNRMNAVKIEGGYNEEGTTIEQGIGGKIYPGDEKVKPPYYIEMNSPKAKDTFFSGGTLPITWSNTGIIAQVNLYYQIEGTNDWIPIIKNIKNTGFYDWPLPFFSDSGEQLTSDNLSAKIVSNSGIDSKIRAIIGAGGDVENIVVLKEGVAYSNEDNISLSVISRPFDSTPTPAPPTIQASVNGAGQVIGGNIINPGSGYIPSVITRILLKVEDNVNPAVYGILQKVGEFSGDVDNTTIISERNRITNVNPTVSQLIEDGYLEVGQSITGEGIQNGTTILSTDPVNNYIELSEPVTSQETGAQFKLSPINAVITIK